MSRLKPRLRLHGDDRPAGGEPDGRGRVRRRPQGTAPHEGRVAVSRARADRQHGPRAGAHLERRRAARPALRRGRRRARARPGRALPRQAAAGRAPARAGGRRRSGDEGARAAARRRRAGGLPRVPRRRDQQRSAARARAARAGERAAALVPGDAGGPRFVCGRAARAHRRRRDVVPRDCAAASASASRSADRRCARARHRAHAGARPTAALHADRGRKAARARASRAARARGARRAGGAAARGRVPSRRARRADGGSCGAVPREPARRGRGDASRSRLTAVLLALCASLAWGVADFGAGYSSRLLPVFVVATTMQIAGLLLAGSVVLIGGLDPPTWEQAGWAAFAGIAGIVGLSAFYRGLAVGTMGIVGPISTTAALVPLVYGLAPGERPSSLQAAGVALAILGVVGASLEPLPEGRGRKVGTGVGLALLAAAGFGCSLIGLSKAAPGGVVWATLVMRIVALPILTTLMLFTGPRRPSRRMWPLLVGAGVCDTGATLL